jgi:hypothetical protein
MPELENTQETKQVRKYMQGVTILTLTNANGARAAHLSSINGICVSGVSRLPGRAMMSSQRTPHVVAQMAVDSEPSDFGAQKACRPSPKFPVIAVSF